jgi:L-ascorbate metabolism protein UlaG (beta-lactamase superfamily)
VPAERVPARRTAPPDDGVDAHWLGQAGFLLDGPESRVVVDAYLSDSLAEKYRGTRFPHVRMEAAPIAPGELRDVDLVLCTHAHTDHLDPGTLGPLAAANPRCRFVVPAPAAATAIERGVPADRLVPAEAGVRLDISPGLSVEPVPAAHEGLETDEAGRHRFLGYVVRFRGRSGGEFSVYHSGDCVPWPGLVETIRGLGIDLALLPVNGRDAERTAAGILGNFTLDEAVALARACGGDRGPLRCVGHHFGLFDFNTVDEARAERRLDELGAGPFFSLAVRRARMEFRRSGAELAQPPRRV